MGLEDLAVYLPCTYIFTYYYLTTISTELGFLWDFVLLSLKTCALYHEKLFIQVVNDISTQVFNKFFSASDTMEAVRGRFCFHRYECSMQARLRDSSVIVAQYALRYKHNKQGG